MGGDITSHFSEPIRSCFEYRVDLERVRATLLLYVRSCKIISSECLIWAYILFRSPISSCKSMSHKWPVHLRPEGLHTYFFEHRVWFPKTAVILIWINMFRLIQNIENTDVGKNNYSTCIKAKLFYINIV